ncbi:hypothetical protein QQP08_000240 [Theobroma cacao]|nr:hypothetical protein QQP08_000240 [Theobroma cacao]
MAVLVQWYCNRDSCGRLAASLQGVDIRVLSYHSGIVSLVIGEDHHGGVSFKGPLMDTGAVG